MEIRCPFCGKKQTQKPLKSWSYGKMIEQGNNLGPVWGASVKCIRYLCKCGKPFNYYFTSKGKSWTIPKSKKTKS